MPSICPRRYAPGGPDERLFMVILDQITHLDSTPLALPLPDDPRLRKICSQLARNPSDNRSLQAWGKTVGATSRTLARLFRAQTSMSFGHWRRQTRILEALRRLAEGESVTEAALCLGYDSPERIYLHVQKNPGDDTRAVFQRAVNKPDRQGTVAGRPARGHSRAWANGKFNSFGL